MASCAIGGGDITVRGGARTASASVSGTVTVTGGPRAARPETMTGNIVFEASIARGAVLDLGTHSGAVRVLLPKGSTPTVEATTVAAPIDNTTPSERRFAAKDASSRCRSAGTRAADGEVVQGAVTLAWGGPPLRLVKQGQTAKRTEFCSLCRCEIAFKRGEAPPAIGPRTHSWSLMMMRTPLGLAALAVLTLTIAAAAPAPLGPPWISIEYPPSPYDASTRDAFLLVHTFHHGTPIVAPVTGKAEGIVGGERRSVALKFGGTSRTGVFALDKQWPSEGTWVLFITANQGPTTT